MANVWQALKKHQAQQGAAKASTAPAETPPAQASGPARHVDSEPLEAKPAAAPPATPHAPAAAEAAAPGAQEPASATEVKVASQTPVKKAMAAAAAGPAAATPRAGRWADVTKFPVKPEYSDCLMTHYDRGGPISEDYRALRTSLLAQCEQKGFCYVVTSAEPREGKTLTCLNLAMVLAERPEQNVAVIDCDLRQGRIAEILNVHQTPGVAELLRGKASTKDILQPTAYPNLVVVASGKAPAEDIAELLNKPEMEQFLREMRRLYDYVLIDTPPINAVSDAGVIGRHSGEALMVVRMNKTRRESVSRAMALLKAACIKPAGVVMTHRRYFIPNFVYRYS